MEIWRLYIWRSYTDYKISKNPNKSIDNLLFTFVKKHFKLWKTLSTSKMKV